MVDAATGILVHVVTAVGPRTVSGALVEDDEPVLSAEVADGLRIATMVLIGARALWVIRAGRAVLAHGFEPEARALDRILVELMAHRTVILGSGASACSRFQPSPLPVSS